MRNVEYNKKLKRYRVGKVAAVIMVLAILVGILALYNFRIKTKKYEKYEVIETVSIQNIDNANWANLGEDILYYTTDGVMCMDEKGEVIWNKSYELEYPIVDICQSTGAIAEYNGTEIHLVSNKTPIEVIDTGMPIKSFSVSKVGVIAVVLEDGEVTWIKVLDARGEVISSFKTTLDESGYPVCVELSDDGMLLAVSYIYTEEAQLRSRVAFYNFGEIGQNKSEMLVSGYDYSNTIVPYVKFIDEDIAFSAADNRLSLYKGDEIPLHNGEIILNDMVQAVYPLDDKVALLFYSQDEKAKYQLNIYDDEATLTESIYFDMDYNEIIIDGSNIIIYNDREISIWNSKGKQIYSGTYARVIDKILITEGRMRYVIISGDSLERIKLY